MQCQLMSSKGDTGVAPTGPSATVGASGPPALRLTAPTGRGGYRPIPGPADRVTFFAEQARNRRISWALGLFVIVAIVLTGIPLGVIAGPMFYIATMPIGLAMTALYPHSAWMLVLVVPVMLLPALFGATVTSHITLTSVQGAHAMHGVWPLVLTTFVLTVLPGALVFLLLWHVVRVVLRRGGGGGILHKLGARAPHPGDAEEHMLVDVVEEMAVAAGIRAPQVAIIDTNVAGGAANAAAVGWSVDDATVVVTRPLLDLLTRDQTQAVIARVVASIANGDLEITFLMLSIFQTVRAVQYALFGVSRARTLRVLWRCVRVALRRTSPIADAERAADEAVAADLLDVGSFHTTLDAALTPHFSVLGCLFAPVLFPLRFAAWTMGFIIGASESVLTGPLVDAAWRSRELLADATAVQLTRDPDGLAGALERLKGAAVMVPKADAVSCLFAAWWAGPAGSDQGGTPVVLFGRKPHVSPDRRLAQVLAIGAHQQAIAGSLGGAVGIVAPSAPGTLDLGANSVVTAIIGVVLLQVVGVMMWITVWLTGIELFALAFVGLWLAQRLGGGPS
jgi:Zn-dependent protease with chaperone function